MPKLSFAFAFGLLTLTAQADPIRAQAALADILRQERVANVSYRVHDDGVVTIVFSARMLEEDYHRVVTRLNTHPDIPGVIAVRDTDSFCRP
ncbi:MAG: hypothetical protein NZ524_04970 [Thiobacillaceae bacterium]|nr:hypothetical protein [Thiobacillaceae bacterium]MCX7673993.1 hypothetical protein [Thiobacillaceae bacterium]MDW8322779.1 hypothetical protein [Burkholderiales bacterium]